MHGKETTANRVMGVLEVASRYVALNFAFLLSIFPFAVVFFLILRLGFGIQESPWVLALIPALFAAPAVGGLYYATNQLAHDRDSSMMIYWQGIKKYLWPSYKWGIMNFVVAFLFSVNIWFYGNATLSFAPYLRVGFIVAAAFWTALQMYTFPLMIEQKVPSLKTALRNSLLILARYPLRSFGFLGLVILIAGVSTYLFFPLWVIISISLIAYLSNKNTIVVLDKLLLEEQKSKKKQEIQDSSESE